jgi:hypothetical protein
MFYNKKRRIKRKHFEPRKEIDAMVYDLYGLRKRIKIVG